MLNGHEIANRIEQLMSQTPQSCKTEVGELLTTKKTASPQAKRKNYSTLLRHLREEKIICELRIVARYLEVPIEYLLLGDMVSPPSETSPDEVAKRLKKLTVQLGKAMKKLEYFQAKELKKPSDQ